MVLDAPGAENGDTDEMTEAEQAVFQIVRTKLNVPAERARVEKMNLGKALSRKIDFNRWLESWGELDLAIVMKIAAHNGTDPVQEAKKWVKMTDEEQLEAWRLARSY